MAVQEDLDLFSAEDPFIVGQVITVFYQNPSNFYKVLLVKITETNSSYPDGEIVITGNFGQIQEDEHYRFYGNLNDHPKFGLQFNAQSYRQNKPTSAAGVIAYLSGEKFPGIGKKTAETIVTHLGEDAIDKISSDENSLAEVPGLNKKKRKLIAETIQASDGMEKIIIGLNNYGFGSQLAYTIYQTYQSETLEIIQEDPYQLVKDIENIGFKKADDIAEQLGFAADSPGRIRAAILYSLDELCLSGGDTYTTAEPLLEESLKTLESSRPFIIEPDAVGAELIHLIEENQLIEEAHKLYIKSLYAAEWGITNSVRRVLNRKKIIYNRHDIPEEIQRLEKRLGISYGKSQKEAIEKALVSPMFILTGGPGTGKTTVLNGIVSLYSELNGLSLDVNEYRDEPFPVLLAAPTGRAAKRMNDTTGLPSSTIHRLLGLNGRENANTEPADRELEGSLLIVDEMSMVDTWLANMLLRAVPEGMQIIIVGDKNQLPSVGPGQVLHDLLDAGQIPKLELNEIYRQGNDSSIIPLAHQVKDGYLPQDFTKNQKDRSFIPCRSYQIEPVIRQIAEKAKAKGYSAQDVQVLAPMYRGPAGINALNVMMQEIFNPNDTGRRKEVVFNEKTYRIGDKVLQLVNNPELNVFNGDMGEITGIRYAKETEDKTDELIIQFDANEVAYKRSEWNKITLAYCCSIHKSQGSEFKMVILPMIQQYNRMLRRDLIYTAITRSSELLILCGELQAFQQGILRSSTVRRTTLKERLLEEIGKTDEALKTYSFESNEAEAEEGGSVGQASDAQSEWIEEGKVKELASNFSAQSLAENYRLTTQMVYANIVDPMIGMEGVKP